MTVTTVVPAEVTATLQERCRQLRSQIRAADELSVPCPPGRWRWADVKGSGYVRKTEEELAADRERNLVRAADLRIRLRSVELFLVAMRAGLLSSRLSGGGPGVRRRVAIDGRDYRHPGGKQ